MPFTNQTFLFILTTLLLAIPFQSIARCQQSKQDQTNSMSISKSDFGKTLDGQAVTQYTLTNRHGNSVQMIDYGAIITAINVPDKTGQIANVTLGFESLAGYLQRHPYFGSTVGRFCNRIANGKFSINDKQYSFVINNGPNHLHGGTVGFDKQMWSTEMLTDDDTVGLRFTLVSPDGQEGYPGTLTTQATYSWSNNNELKIQFTATTDAATHVNLTNHAYFNLAGAGNGNVLQHELKMPCDQTLVVDETMIPVGETNSVVDTPFDFREYHVIGDRIGDLATTKGYDHCFVVPGENGQLRWCATALDRSSGRAMEVSTTQPGVQLYTGNFLPGTDASAGFGQHEGFCLETQHYPDAPNKPDFPTTLLLPEQEMRETTIFRFYVEE